MPSTGHYPPPTRPEARYDAVVARGRRLQRRDRMTRALVTTGAAAIVVLVLGVGVIGATRGGDDDQGPVADPTSTTEGPTTTTAAPTGLEVTALAVDGAIEVDVDDPAVPSGAGTKACVYVRLQPEGDAQVATAETTACWIPADGDAVTEVALPRTVGAEIGCAASVEPVTAERPDGAAESPDGTTPGSAGTSPDTTTSVPTGEVHHSFRFSLPADLPAGSYVAEITGVTGVGDGCPTATPGDDEAAAVASVGITVG